MEEPAEPLHSLVALSATRVYELPDEAAIAPGPPPPPGLSQEATEGATHLDSTADALYPRMNTATGSSNALQEHVPIIAAAAPGLMIPAGGVLAAPPAAMADEDAAVTAQPAPIRPLAACFAEGDDGVRPLQQSGGIGQGLEDDDEIEDRIVGMLAGEEDEEGEAARAELVEALSPQSAMRLQQQQQQATAAAVAPWDEPDALLAAADTQAASAQLLPAAAGAVAAVAAAAAAARSRRNTASGAAGSSGGGAGPTEATESGSMFSEAELKRLIAQVSDRFVDLDTEADELDGASGALEVAGSFLFAGQGAGSRQGSTPVVGSRLHNMVVGSTYEADLDASALQAESSSAHLNSDDGDAGHAEEEDQQDSSTAGEEESEEEPYVEEQTAEALADVTARPVPLVRLFNVPAASFNSRGQSASSSPASSSPAIQSPSSAVSAAAAAGRSGGTVTSSSGISAAGAASPPGAVAGVASSVEGKEGVLAPGAHLSIRTVPGRYLADDLDSPSEAGGSGTGRSAASGASSFPAASGRDSDASAYESSTCNSSSGSGGSDSGGSAGSGGEAEPGPPARAAAAKLAAEPAPAANSLMGTLRGPQRVSMGTLKAMALAEEAKQQQQAQLKGVAVGAGADKPAETPSIQSAPPPASRIPGPHSWPRRDADDSSAAAAVAAADKQDESGQSLRATTSVPVDFLPPSPFAVPASHHRMVAGQRGKGGASVAARRRGLDPLKQQHSAPERDPAAGTGGIATRASQPLSALMSPFISAQTAALAAKNDAAAAAATAAAVDAALIPAWLAVPAPNAGGRSPPKQGHKGHGSAAAPRSPTKSMGAAGSGGHIGRSPEESKVEPRVGGSLDSLDDFLRDRVIVPPRYPSGTGEPSKSRIPGSPTHRRSADTGVFAESHSSQRQGVRRDGEFGRAAVSLAALDDADVKDGPGRNSSSRQPEVLAGAEAEGEDSYGHDGDVEEEEHEEYDDDDDHDHDEGEGEDEEGEYEEEEDDDEAYEVDDEDEDEEGASQSRATAQEVNALKDELSAQKAVAAGLRGELRKFSQLTANLEAQMMGYRAHHPPGTAGAAGVTVSAEASAPLETVLSVSTTAVNMHAAAAAARAAKSAAAGGASGAEAPLSPGGAKHEGMLEGHAAGHTEAAPPPAGLEADKRLALYREALSGSVSMAAGTMREELLAAQDVIKGKEHLDSGSEKVILIKLQKIISAGAGATRHIELMQQDAARRAPATRSVSAHNRDPGLPPSHFGSLTASADEDSEAAAAAAIQAEQLARLSDENERLQRELLALKAQLAPPTLVSPFAAPTAAAALASSPGSPLSSSTSLTALRAASLPNMSHGSAATNGIPAASNRPHLSPPSFQKPSAVDTRSGAGSGATSPLSSPPSSGGQRQKPPAVDVFKSPEAAGGVLSPRSATSSLSKASPKSRDAAAAMGSPSHTSPRITPPMSGVGVTDAGPGRDVADPGTPEALASTSPSGLRSFGVPTGAEGQTNSAEEPAVADADAADAGDAAGSSGQPHLPRQAEPSAAAGGEEGLQQDPSLSDLALTGGDGLPHGVGASGKAAVAKHGKTVSPARQSDVAAMDAEAAGWKLERQMLLKKIADQDEQLQARGKEIEITHQLQLPADSQQQLHQHQLQLEKLQQALEATQAKGLAAEVLLAAERQAMAPTAAKWQQQQQQQDLQKQQQQQQALDAAQARGLAAEALLAADRQAMAPTAANWQQQDLQKQQQQALDASQAKGLAAEALLTAERQALAPAAAKWQQPVQQHQQDLQQQQQHQPAVGLATHAPNTAQAAALDSQAAGLDQQVAQLRGQLEAGSARVAALESQLSQVSSRRVSLASEVVRLEGLLLAQQATVSGAQQLDAQRQALHEQLNTIQAHAHAQAEQLVLSQQQLRSARAALADKEAQAQAVHERVRGFYEGHQQQQLEPQPPPPQQRQQVPDLVSELLWWRSRCQQLESQRGQAATELPQDPVTSGSIEPGRLQTPLMAGYDTASAATNMTGVKEAAGLSPQLGPVKAAAPAGSEAAGAVPPVAAVSSPKTESTRLRLAALLQLVAATDAKLRQQRRPAGAGLSAALPTAAGPQPAASGWAAGAAVAALLDDDIMTLPLDSIAKKLEKRVRGVLLAALEARQQHQQQLLAAPPANLQHHQHQQQGLPAATASLGQWAAPRGGVTAPAALARPPTPSTLEPWTPGNGSNSVSASTNVSGVTNQSPSAQGDMRRELDSLTAENGVLRRQVADQTALTAQLALQVEAVGGKAWLPSTGGPAGGLLGPAGSVHSPGAHGPARPMSAYTTSPGSAAPAAPAATAARLPMSFAELYRHQTQQRAAGTPQPGQPQ